MTAFWSYLRIEDDAEVAHCGNVSTAECADGEEHHDASTASLCTSPHAPLPLYALPGLIITTAREKERVCE